MRSAADDQVAEGVGFAFAGEAFLGGPVGRGWVAEMDGFLYSGLGDGVRPFRPPWGRWPKWSELYIYTLIAEGSPGRVHVAAWENIAAPRITLKLDRPDVLVSAALLTAPEPDWRTRGLLATIRYSFGITGNLSLQQRQRPAFDGR